MRGWAFLFALLVSSPLATLAGESCRPVRTLGTGSQLQFDLQTSNSPRLTAALDGEFVLADDASSFGLDEAHPSKVLPSPAIVRAQALMGASLGAAGGPQLVFDSSASEPVVVRHDGLRYILRLERGVPVDSDGHRLAVAPLYASARTFVLDKGTRLSRDKSGRLVAASGSRLTWRLGDDATFDFQLAAPARLEQASAEPSADMGVTIVKPTRLLPGAILKMQVHASGFDFRTRPLSFCFAGIRDNKPMPYSDAVPGRLVSESSGGALFEVPIPNGMESGWVSQAASVRVLGVVDNKVALDASQTFVVSNYWVAFLSGFVLIVVLLVLSMLILREPNPLGLATRLVLHRTNRFSLSNLQILLWTLLVLYALSFVWIANGMLLDLSSGVLVLLGISGGTSVLARGVEVMNGVDTAPMKPSDAASFKDLVTNDKGEFDLLRFQMLGFTLFTLAYCFQSVIRSEGLPEIPQNLYLLMGISSGTYVGGKLADNMKPASTEGAGEGAAAMDADQAGLTSVDIQGVQKGLHIAETGLLDDATRAAIVRYKQEQGLLPADGSLNPDLVKRLGAP